MFTQGRTNDSRAPGLISIMGLPCTKRYDAERRYLQKIVKEDIEDPSTVILAMDITVFV